MVNINRGCLGLVLAFLSVSVQAVSFDRIVSLGDSLLDDPEGLRSPLVSEQLAQRLNAPLTKLAEGGSTSSSLIASGQHTAAAASFGPGDLALVWIGGNDFLDAAPSIITGNTSFLDTLESNMDLIVSTLLDAGIEVVVFNLPDIAQVPGVIDQLGVNSAIRDASASWRDRLNDLAASKGFTVVDVFTIFDSLTQQPELFAIDGALQTPSPDFGEVLTCPTCTWADPIHPSALGQGVITNGAVTQLNATFDPAGVAPITLLSKTEMASLASASTFVTASGLWFDPAFDGEGYDIVQSDGGITVFFYGYDSNDQRLWLISELLTDRLALNQPVTLNMSVGDGGSFQQPIPGAQLGSWGSLTLTVTECGAGQFLLDGRDGTKNHAVVKLADGIGTGCFSP